MIGTQLSVAIFLRHVLNIFINCFLLCRGILPKKSKQMKISILSDIDLEDLRVMRNLYKFFLIQLLIKKSGNEFSCQIFFKYLISLCKICNQYIFYKIGIKK